MKAIEKKALGHIKKTLNSFESNNIHMKLCDILDVVLKSDDTKQKQEFYQIRQSILSVYGEAMSKEKLKITESLSWINTLLEEV